MSATREPCAAAVQYSPAVHRLAVVLTLSVFPLIWVGGLVTTYGAGMAVPDWPGTYGWNMFLYPPSTWLYGGFDLMVEHGHRLLGSLAGLLAIALLLAAIRWEPRRWFRWWCGLVLVAVIAQGVLGGLRVLLDERLAALIHGCIGQLFLAMATATAVMSSRGWRTIPGGDQRQPSSSSLRPPGRAFAIGTSWLLVAVYAQVIAGAQLRHATGEVSPTRFMGYVHLHLAIALLVLLTSACIALVAGSSRGLLGGVRRPALLILVVVLVQLGLGGGTWIVNYALPWSELTSWLAAYVIQAKGYWESVIVTAHVATGAVLVSLTTLLSLRTWRSRVVCS